MSEVNEKIENQEENVNEEIKTTEFVEPSGKGRRIIKICLTALAAVATGVVGFVLGRTTASKDDEEDETTEEKTA